MFVSGSDQIVDWVTKFVTGLKKIILKSNFKKVTSAQLTPS